MRKRVNCLHVGKIDVEGARAAYIRRIWGKHGCANSPVQVPKTRGFGEENGGGVGGGAENDDVAQAGMIHEPVEEILFATHLLIHDFYKRMAIVIVLQFLWWRFGIRRRWYCGGGLSPYDGACLHHGEHTDPRLVPREQNIGASWINGSRGRQA